MPKPVGSSHSINRTPERVRVRGGYTAIEMLIATTVFLLVVGGGMAAVHHGGDAWSTIVQTTSIQSSSRSAIQQVVDELRQAAAIDVDTTDPLGDILRFQLPLSVNNGIVTWGARDYRQASNQIPGGYVAYRVVNKVHPAGRQALTLVRQILDENLKPQGSDLLVARHIDDLLKGHKGFAINQTGDLYQVTIRLHRDPTLQGRAGRISLSTTTTSRNANTAAAATAKIANPSPTNQLNDLPSAIDYVNQLLATHMATALGDLMQVAANALNAAQSELQGPNPDTLAARDSVDSAISAVQTAVDDRLLNSGKGQQLISSLEDIRDSL